MELKYAMKITVCTVSLLALVPLSALGCASAVGNDEEGESTTLEAKYRCWDEFCCGTTPPHPPVAPHPPAAPQPPAAVPQAAAAAAVNAGR